MRVDICCLCDLPRSLLEFWRWHEGDLFTGEPTLTYKPLYTKDALRILKRWMCHCMYQGSISQWAYDVKTTLCQRRCGIRHQNNVIVKTTLYQRQCEVMTVKTTLFQRRGDVMSWRHLDVDTTLFWRRVPAVIGYCSFPSLKAIMVLAKSVDISSVSKM